MSENKATLLWVDLEMTGLDPEEDRILEVAAIATDWDFHEFATYTAVTRVEPELMKERMVGDFWEEFSHVRADLMEQNEHGDTGEAVEDALLAFIDEHFDDDVRPLLGGNSIHQDRRFIRNEWPRLDERLHYRMLDVSAWKVVMEAKFGQRRTKPPVHRALDDIRASISELQFYLERVQ